MSDTKNTGPAKNRGAAAGNAAELNIPTLGAIGNEPQASTQQEGQKASSTELSMADIQRQADAEQTKAMHRPAFFRPDREQEAEVPRMDFEMPISGSLDAMRRPDQYIEPVVDFGRFKDKAEELAFLEEMVMIRIHETADATAENPVPLGVNGRMVYITRGEDTIVRRKYVEQLLRAKPEGISTKIMRDGDGNVRNMISKTRALKYPFSIVRDDNPRGRAWERKIRAEA